METEVLLRVAAVAIAGMILLSNFDYSSVLNYISSVFKRKKVITPETPDEVTFLDIVESWHVLRKNCETCGLHEAVSKIDEVFPLLNMED